VTAKRGNLVQPLVGMIIGYFTSWPASVWQVNRGIKVSM
jgi:hypothetical protein